MNIIALVYAIPTIVVGFVIVVGDGNPTFALLLMFIVASIILFALAPFALVYEAAPAPA